MKAIRRPPPDSVGQHGNAKPLVIADAGKQSIFVLASLALFVLVYTVIAWAVFQCDHPALPDLTPFLPESRGVVAPEAPERLCYLLGLACVVVVPAFFWMALTRWDRVRPGDWAWLQSTRVLWVRDAALTGGLVLWLLWVALETEMPVASLRLALAIPLLLALPYLARRALPSNRHGVHVLAGVVVISLTALLVIDDAWYLGIWHVSLHTELLVGAINQVYHGQTILVDTASQYGILYPYLAAWVLAPCGLTITHISLFFAAISLLTFVFFYWMICEKIGYCTYWSFLLLIPVLAVTQPFVVSAWFETGLNAGYDWIYYQYHPLRVVFGAFFLGFVPWYFRCPTTCRMVFGYLVGGFGVLWNMDTGMVLLLAWTGVLVLDCLAWRPVVVGRLLVGVSLHVGMLLLTLAGAFTAYAIWARYRSGQFPQPEMFLKYQSIFYGAGFMMLPMRLWEWWQPVVLVYVVTIADCLRRVIRGTGKVWVRWYFFIAVYGLGIFSYYQGRSHIYTLPAVVYPAMILAGFYLIDLLRHTPKRPPWIRLGDPSWRYATIRSAACGLFVLVGFVHFVVCLPSLIGCMPSQDGRYGGNQVGMIERNSQDLRRYLENSPCVIFSPYSNYLHLKTGSYSALPFCSPSEVILVDQLRAVQDALDREDTRYMVVDGHPMKIEYLKRLRLDRFHVVRRYQDGTVLMERHGRKRFDSDSSSARGTWCEGCRGWTDRGKCVLIGGCVGVSGS